MTQISMFSQLEVMKDSSTLNKLDSKSEKKKELKLKLPSKYLQLDKIMLLKDFWKFNSKA